MLGRAVAFSRHRAASSRSASTAGLPLAGQQIFDPAVLLRRHLSQLRRPSDPRPPRQVAPLAHQGTALHRRRSLAAAFRPQAGRKDTTASILRLTGRRQASCASRRRQTRCRKKCGVDRRAEPERARGHSACGRITGKRLWNPVVNGNSQRLHCAGAFVGRQVNLISRHSRARETRERRRPEHHQVVIARKPAGRNSTSVVTAPLACCSLAAATTQTFTPPMQRRADATQPPTRPPTRQYAPAQPSR